jgi:hypothetical protein
MPLARACLPKTNAQRVAENSFARSTVSFGGKRGTFGIT